MKKIINHPPRPERPTMWRSMEEFQNTPEFEETLQREFPAGAAVYEESGLSKRDFLKLMGASMALAGVGLTGCRRPPAFLVPLTKGVEWTVPGKFLYYATAMPTRLGAIPLIATTSDGRPTKIEGNPLHPYSNGATDGFAQASVLDLYDPNRLKSIKQGGASTDAAAFATFLSEVRQAAVASNGNGLAILADAINSPSRDRLREELQAEFPQILWAEYEPLGSGEATSAAAVAFGANTAVRPNFEEADVILALDSDFLDSNETGPSYAVGFYSRRKPDQERPMNRLYVVENHYTSTGGLADHRLRVRACDIGAFLAAISEEVASLTGNGILASAVSAFPAGEVAFDKTWVSECAKDLVRAKGNALVLVGSGQPAPVQALGFALNAALGSLGSTLQGYAAPAVEAVSIEDLAAAIKSQSVQTLIILGGNPAYNAPADLKFADLIATVPVTMHLSLYEDETSKLCRWVVPAAHYLETWGDTRTLDGTYTSIQPMILPLWDGLGQLDVLAQLLGRPVPEGPEIVRETFQKRIGTSGSALDSAWNEYVRTGFLAESAYPSSNLALNGGAIASTLKAYQPSPATGAELVFLKSSSVDDGRYANNSWLQETPDFVTKLTWDNAALISPADAEKLGIKDGDMVEITADETKLECAALVAPGHADDSVSIALGYGRKDVSALMQNVGFDAYPFRNSAAPRFRKGVAVKAAGGRKYKLARPQEHQSMEGRDLFREGTLERFKKNPTFALNMGMDGHLPPEISIYKNPLFQPELVSQEQWAMTVDLNICSGCNACLVACQAENNVPVVGKDQVIRGRDMAWIRIDRYFASPESSLENPEMVAQMITCQHCENAPCETVCPVNATVHSEDGLNLMAYNRCIGTRYCANNCPWKVRRFNYFDYNQRPIDKLYFGPLAKKGMADSLKMSKNPNVTVRMRGVMEKCTFCIQRIEEAKIARSVKAGASDKSKVPVAPFKTACQQACPSEAIVFGDENNPDRQVAKLRKDPRGFTMLKYLNARPRITYLARIKNPNPAMPGAELIGNINTPDHHAEHHGEAGHAAPDGHGAVDPHGTHQAPAAHH